MLKKYSSFENEKSVIKCEGLFELCPLLYTWNEVSWGNAKNGLCLIYKDFVGNLKCSLQIKC